MKRSWILSTLAVVVVMTTLLAHADSGNNSYALMSKEKKDILSKASQKDQEQTLNDNNDFACNLFRNIRQKKQGDCSIIISPISVSYMLGMLAEGAEGDTRRQITDVLGLGASVKDINKYFKKIMDETAQIDTTVTINIANSIFANSAMNISLISQYQAAMQKYYNAPALAFDFSDNSNLSIINNWSKTHTGGMIPKILDSLDPFVAMYLLNAVYFKASWTEKFDPKDTRDRYFTKQDGSVVEHKMMHLKINAAFGINDLCEMLSLPYGNGAFSMNVLLPRKGKTIDDVIQSLSSQKLEQQRMHEMTTRSVDILLPRFTTESETYLEQVLSTMGMPLTFNPRAAQFTKMAKDSELWVSMMKQKARIEVNEKGTKAAAVTVVGMKTRSVSGGGSVGVEFHATRPFVYYIVDNSTGMIYFMGTYCGEEGTFPKEVTIDCTDCLFDAIVLPEVPVTRAGRGAERTLPEVSVKCCGKSVEQVPQFPGGEAALMKYLMSHTNYPPMAAESDIDGRVIVQFVIDTTGKVGEVKVVQSANQYLDREAVRVVKSLPKFTPGQQNGKPVDVWYVLPVNFQ